MKKVKVNKAKKFNQFLRKKRHYEVNGLKKWGGDNPHRKLKPILIEHCYIVKKSISFWSTEMRFVTQTIIVTCRVLFRFLIFVLKKQQQIMRTKTSKQCCPSQCLIVLSCLQLQG